MEEVEHEGRIGRGTERVDMNAPADPARDDQSWVEVETEDLTRTTDQPVDPLTGEDPGV